MKKHLLIIALLISCLTLSAVHTKAAVEDTIKLKKLLPHVRKFYIGSATDAGIFSTASIQRTLSNYYNPGGAITTNTMGVLRFSYMINFGVTFNFNFGRHFGLYTGVDIKNIGFIEHPDNGEVIKRRTYNVGAPIGIKIGNMADKGSYLFLGAGIDAPINYKEKEFVVRNQKTKYNEWFSNATPSTMPYVFAGFALRNSISLKAQYYPNNFLNPDYAAKSGYPSNAGYTVHIMMLSLGFPMSFSKHGDMMKKHVGDPNTATM